MFDFYGFSRGRGSYRGRGRGNYYRQDRNAAQQHHQHQQHQPSSVQQHSNVPYYDQSMNSGMQSGQGGYNDGGYHDAPPNRYDWIYSFSLNSNCRPLVSNGFHKSDNFIMILWVIFKTLVPYFWLNQLRENEITTHVY